MICRNFCGIMLIMNTISSLRNIQDDTPNKNTNKKRYNKVLRIMLLVGSGNIYLEIATMMPTQHVSIKYFPNCEKYSFKDIG